MISIILPTLNELQHNCLEEILKELSFVRNAQIIVVDGGSCDGTQELVQKFKIDVIECLESNRAQRLYCGIEKSVGDILLLHHPRSLVKATSIQKLEDISHTTNIWGGFIHKFDENSMVFRFISWYSNTIRARRGIVYLDHCIFVQKKMLKKITFPRTDIFEDTLLSEKLRKISSPIILPFESVTSTVRFRKNGIWQQIILNQIMKLLFLIGINTTKLNTMYEKKLQFNT
jgi:hypothetical protein